MRHDTRWTAEKTQKYIRLLAPYVYRQTHPIPNPRYRELASPQIDPPLHAETDAWPTLEPGTYWGQRETDFIMRTQFTVPDGWDKPLVLHLPIGDAPDFIHPEALVYIDGEPYAAVDRFHQDIPLRAQWADGQPHDLALHGYTGIWSTDMDGDDRSTQLRLGHLSVAQIHTPTRDFLTLARNALEAANHLDDNHPTKWKLLDALHNAFLHIDWHDNLYNTLPQAHATLKNGVQQAGDPHPAHITAAGHAHLDVAWLWTLAQTRRKAGRTFHNVLRLMEEFPDYHFTQSQPQLYEYVRQDYPQLFADIKKQVEAGRWEPTGGMWVEADCNLSGGESLARQFLLGQTYLKEHFGDAVTPILWLPDVFGYAWNLPQLIKQAGLEYFFTIKIGWSQYNRLPYDSFWWQGLDGTQVLTHFSTTPEPETDIKTVGTYNAKVSPRSAIDTWRNFQQKDTQTSLFMSYGYGDGGGGPNREMLENLDHLANFPGMPQMSPGSAISFFERMENESGDKLPVWNGELYLELHRGTYTTQGRSKHANRKSEFLLHDAEFFAVVAAQLDNQYTYPAADLRQAWELVCLNQFHDILPGSSIHAVYEDSMEQYADAAELAHHSLASAKQVITRHYDGDLLIANPTAFERDDLALWPDTLPAGQHLVDAQGNVVHTQLVQEGTLLAPHRLAPYSITSLELRDGSADAPDAAVNASPNHLENPYIRVEFNAAGDITRIYDKSAGREVLPENAVANQLQAFDDRPLQWDAWDVDIYYEDQCWIDHPAESIQVIESGPLRATVEVRRYIKSSLCVQRISITHNSPQITFNTTIDWQERHLFLKAAFPVDVLSPKATYEIQWGNVERPTHRNTSWDWARFESCAQKWVDLSEGNYGVSLLNDCKYGHDIHNNVLRLSLLRGATHPDPQADLGQHHFTYALLPHQGDWRKHTARAAYALNDPLHVLPAHGDQSTSDSWVSTDAPNIIIETVKQAEDGHGIIVRLYEYWRQRGPVTLHTAFPIEAAHITNLLEDNQTPLTPDGQRVTLPNVTPYQIVSVRLIPATH